MNAFNCTTVADLEEKDYEGEAYKLGNSIKQYIIAAIHNVADNFKSSRAYQKLPATLADLKKHKSDEGSDYKKPDEENEDFDPMSWSPLQEVIDSMPSFDMPA